MRIHVKPGSKLWLMHPDMTISEKAFGIVVDEDKLEKFRAEATTSVPHLPADEQEIWAIYNAHRHQPSKSAASPVAPVPLSYNLMVALQAIIIIILLVILLFGVKVHAQDSKDSKVDNGSNGGEATVEATPVPIIPPMTVLPLQDADKVKLQSLILQQDKLIISRRDHQLAINDIDKQLDQLTAQVNEAAQSIAATGKIDTIQMVLDLDKLAWVTKPPQLSQLSQLSQPPQKPQTGDSK